MRPLVAAAWTIARRDYVSTVFSRMFILFLVTPLFPALFGGVFGALGAQADEQSAPPRHIVAVAMAATDGQAIDEAHKRLGDRLGADTLPDLVGQPAGSDPRRLLAGKERYDAVLSGTLDDPHFLRSGDAPDGTRDRVALLLDTARADARLGAAAPRPVDLPDAKLPRRPAERKHDKVALARGSQVLLFFLTVLLAGMSLSTFIEEKSNKVIEVLAAAVPLDAIFAGKLAGMLAISMTGVAIWLGAGLIVTGAIAPHFFAALPVPAVGWPVFLLLLLLYFIGSYLLLGAVFLGLGSQAGSPREIQVLSMPVTMAQLVLFGFASAGVAHPEGWLAKAAAIFPWSSPLAMVARAAELPTLWPHLLALAWQLLWLVLALRLAAGLFRKSVLKSGAPAGRRWFGRRAGAQ
jgi:ABC-2 type transport system permease protein